MSHHCHDHACHCHQDANISELSESELHFLHHMVSHHFFPLTQFILKSDKEKEFEIISLSPVYIADKKETLSQIKATGKRLLELENKGFITLDFEMPLTNYAYEEYYQSDAFAHFKQTVEEAKRMPNFLGNIATLELGSMAPTEKTIQLLSK